MIFRNSAFVLARTITIQFCYLLFIAANYYFNTLYNIPHLLKNKRYLAFGLLFVLSIAITALLRSPVFIFVTTYLFHLPNKDFNYVAIILNSFLNIFIWVTLLLAGTLVVGKIRSDWYIEKIEREKIENELKFLRAQFNPHFLFNSINSIYGEIHKTNKRAREMLLKFSEMLRYQLYECNVEQIDLQREMRYLHNYVDLQKSRMDERIRVSICDRVVDGNLIIAPLLLVTFLENAFKYVGFCEDRENFIDIQIQKNGEWLHFQITNSKDLGIQPEEHSSGLGILNARRRLELIYPGKHKLRITDGKTLFDVNLIVADL